MRTTIAVETDSTIVPPPNQRFSLTKVLMTARHEEGRHKKKTSSYIFLLAQDYKYRTMMSGC